HTLLDFPVPVLGRRGKGVEQAERGPRRTPIRVDRVRLLIASRAIRWRVEGNRGNEPGAVLLLLAGQELAGPLNRHLHAFVTIRAGVGGEGVAVAGEGCAGWVEAGVCSPPAVGGLAGQQLFEPPVRVLGLAELARDEEPEDEALVEGVGAPRRFAPVDGASC